MATIGSLSFSHKWEICKNQQYNKQFKGIIRSDKSHQIPASLSSVASRQDSWSINLSIRLQQPLSTVPNRLNLFKCNCFLNSGQAFGTSAVKNGVLALSSALQGRPIMFKLLPAVGIIVFAVWGLGPLMRQSRNIFLHKSDGSWGKSNTHYVMTSYLQPLLLWTGATLICRALDPVVMPSEPSQIVKQRLLTFVRSLSTVLALAYCLSSAIQQTQNLFMETKDATDSRNMGFEFAGKAVYTAVWVAAVSLFMELLGFSTQKWLTAGGLGTVLLTLAGREIFTNFLSSAMIHATRPFIVNEWIKAKVEGYEVSGTVEHVGWWSPTIIRGEDREAIHIPNHKFTMNVVRNLTQKTHWRIKTHLAISHLDVNKINIIVADMRKVLSKNPQVEQQRLHRRVFLENVDPENQALLILISCFVKTSHYEEYLCVKEAILLDLLRVISHHRARLATPIRTVQKIYNDSDLDGFPFADSVFTRGRAPSNRPLLLIEPNYKVNGEEKSKGQNSKSSSKSSSKGSGVAKDTLPSDSKAEGKSGVEPKTKDTQASADSKAEGKSGVESKTKDTQASTDSKAEVKSGVESKTKDTQASIDSKAEGKSRVESKTKDTEASDGKAEGKGGVGDKVGSDAKEDKKPNPETTIRDDKNVSNKAAAAKSGMQKEGKVTEDSTEKKESDTESKKGAETRGGMEENIVLGVALDGSKRTLPIEEGMDEVKEKELSKSLSTKGSEKDHKKEDKK